MSGNAETYVPESECRQDKGFDVVASPIEWNGGKWFFVRTVLDWLPIGTRLQRLLFNLFRYVVLLTMAAVVDVVIMLISLISQSFVFVLKRLFLWILDVVKGWLIAAFQGITRLVVFAGYLAIVLIIILNFSEVKILIIKLFKLLFQ